VSIVRTDVPEQIVFEGQPLALLTTPLDPVLQRTDGTGVRQGLRFGFPAQRKYLGSWEIDSDGDLYLVDVDIWVEDLLALPSFDGWIGPCSSPPSGIVALDRHPGFVSSQLPPQVRPPVNVKDARWMTFDDEQVILGVQAPPGARWPPHGERHIWIDAYEKPWLAPKPGDLLVEPIVDHPASFARSLALDDARLHDHQRWPPTIAFSQLYVDLRDLDLETPPWTQASACALDDDGTRRGLGYWARCYVERESERSRLPLRDLTVSRAKTRVGTLDDFGADGATRVHATWFTGTLRLAHEIAVNQPIVCDWDDVATEDDTVLQIVAGRVVDL